MILKPKIKMSDMENFIQLYFQKLPENFDNFYSVPGPWLKMMCPSGLNEFSIRTWLTF